MRQHSIQDGEHLATCWCQYEQKPTMSDHAKVTEGDVELLIKVGAAINCMAFDDARQLLADAIRDARLKEAMLWDTEPSADATRDHEYHILFNSCCFRCRKECIEQLKRGEA